MQFSILGNSARSAQFAVWLAAPFLTVVSVLAAVQGAPAATSGRYLDPIFSTIRVDNNLVYGRVKHADGSVEKLRLDMYRPVGDTRLRRPVVIFVHGGDSSIDKGLERNRTVSQGFAARGFVAASINYRKGTSGGTREAQYDTRAAVRWFKANAATYRVNPGQIILIGSSAGAMNVLHVAFNPNDPGDSGNPSYPSTVAAAISVAGTDTEPQNIGPKEAPIAMIHAADDQTIPIAAARVTCEQTKLFGNVCEFFEYAKGGHPPGFLIKYRRQITEQASRFICRNVLGNAACNDRNGDGVVDH